MFLNGMYYTTSSTCRCQNGRYCMCSCSQVLPVLQLHCSMQVKCPTRILCKLNEKLIPFLQTWMQTNYLSVLVAVYHFHSLWFCTSVIGTQELVITHYQWMWWKMYYCFKNFFLFQVLVCHRICHQYRHADADDSWTAPSSAVCAHLQVQPRSLGAPI